MLFTETSGRFSPGHLIASEDLLTCVAKEELLNAYCHHLNCDWGDVPDSVQRSNDYALNRGDALLSAYTSTDGIRFLIVTEADRSATILLLPEEY